MRQLTVIAPPRTLSPMLFTRCRRNRTLQTSASCWGGLYKRPGHDSVGRSTAGDTPRDFTWLVRWRVTTPGDVQIRSDKDQVAAVDLTRDCIRNVEYFQLSTGLAQRGLQA